MRAMRPETEKNIKVLCVSDDTRACDVIKSIFDKWNDVITPIHETDSRRALTMASTDQYDCILITDGTAGGDTLNLVAEFKKRQIGVPLIVLSSSGDELRAVKAIKAGAYDYIPLGAIENEENRGMLIDSVLMSISRSEEKAREEEEAARPADQRRALPEPDRALSHPYPAFFQGRQYHQFRQ